MNRFSPVFTVPDSGGVVKIVAILKRFLNGGEPNRTSVAAGLSQQISDALDGISKTVCQLTGPPIFGQA